jgi:hypothetical protein
MTSISHERPALARTPSWISSRDMWASLSIISIWLAVLFTAIYGPDFKSADAGGNGTVIPSVVFVALLAMFATIAIARHGFERGSNAS